MRKKIIIFGGATIGKNECGYWATKSSIKDYLEGFLDYYDDVHFMTEGIKDKKSKIQSSKSKINLKSER